MSLTFWERITSEMKGQVIPMLEDGTPGYWVRVRVRVRVKVRVRVRVRVRGKVLLFLVSETHGPCVTKTKRKTNNQFVFLNWPFY